MIQKTDTNGGLSGLMWTRWECAQVESLQWSM